MQSELLLQRLASPTAEREHKAPLQTTCPPNTTMTISLPYLLVAGLIAAPVGVSLLAAQLLWPHRLSLLAGGVGGLGSCLLLGLILHLVEQDFMGWHRPLAWLVAFCAGYAAAGVAPYLWHLGGVVHKRFGHASER